jgi:hypothetical protein
MNEKIRMALGTLLLGSALAIGPFAYSLDANEYDGDEWGEHDDEHEGSEHDSEETVLAFKLFGNKQDSIMPEEQAMYKEECAACHIAYPAKFLPAASWHKIMTGLDDHFGENAELDADTTAAISKYLQVASSQGRPHKLLRKLGDEVPLRITKMPGYRRIHHELPKDVLQRDPKLTSMSQCNACHREAERGIFDEDDVDIPGIGRWDD